MPGTEFRLVNGTQYCEGTKLVTLAAGNKSDVVNKLLDCGIEKVYLAQFAFRPAKDPASSPHCLIVSMPGFEEPCIQSRQVATYGVCELTSSRGLGWKAWVGIGVGACCLVVFGAVSGVMYNKKRNRKVFFVF